MVMVNESCNSAVVFSDYSNFIEFQSGLFVRLCCNVECKNVVSVKMLKCKYKSIHMVIETCLWNLYFL